MGLETSDELREFCLELSSDLPSPGGGSASAAAGAMAASLLIMVCGVTAKSKKHEASRPRLAELQRALERNRDELLNLVREDAEAYDSVVDAIRLKKSEPGNQSDSIFQHALRHAADVPMRTADVCVQVLEKAVEVANVGTKSASSDTGVAWELALAGFRGAKKNVAINLGGMEDNKFADVARKGLQMSEGRISDLERRVRAVPGILSE